MKIGIIGSGAVGSACLLALVVRESRRDRVDNEPGQPEANPPPVEIEFRQGYVVQLNMAGRFTFPALSIEPHGKIAPLDSSCEPSGFGGATTA